jgi:WD40 repeat protein
MHQESDITVFLSHNSADKSAVETIMRRLEAHTPPIRCWLDKADLRAQGTWMQQLEDVIHTCDAAALFYGPHGFGPVHQAERQLLLDRAMRQSETFRLIPILLPGTNTTDVGGFAKLHNWVDFSDGLDSPAAMERLIALLRGEAPRETLAGDEVPDDVEPYRGLERFDGQHSGFFFGRDREISELCERIKAWPFVAVIGGSGSGKSSLVRAGLQTPLAHKAHPSLRNAIEITVVPGSNPTRALADQLAGHGEAGAGKSLEVVADSLERRFRDRPDGLLTLLTSRFPREDQWILLHIDQFEELFTHCVSPKETPGHCREQTNHFVALLSAVAGSRLDRIRIVITLRADFFDRCLEVPLLVPLVQNHQLLLGELTREALHEVILRPAQQSGAFFEKGLVARIEADVVNEHGSLPLLQHALKELWARRRGRWLTNEGYDETGGVAGALRKRADATLGQFTPTQREIARNLFLRLTTLGEGVSDTRRRVKLSEMYPADPAARLDVENVIDKLSGKAARLIVTNDDGTAEVTHESLIQQWDELRKWLDANREKKRLQDRLRDAAHEWWATCHEDPQRRDASYLWSGGRLQDANELGRTEKGIFNDLEQAFLRASIRKRDREHRKKIALTALAAALVSVVAITAYVANYRFTMAVIRQRENAVLGGYNQGIVLVDAIWRSDRRAASRELNNPKKFPDDLRDFTWHYLNRRVNNKPRKVVTPKAFHRNRDLIAAAPTTDVRLAWVEVDGQLWLWIPDEQDQPLPLTDVGKAQLLSFSNDAQRLLWTRGDGELEFYDIAKKQTGRIAGNEALKNATAFSVSADCKRLLFTVGGTIHQMDLDKGTVTEVLRLGMVGATVTRLQQSKDGQLFVATHDAHFTLARSTGEQQQFDGDCQAFSPTGTYLLATSATLRRQSTLFSVNGLELRSTAVFKTDDGWGRDNDAEFSPDGETIAVSSQSGDSPGELSVYESASGRLLSRSIGELTSGGAEDFLAIRFAGNGRALFTWSWIINAGGSENGELKLRDTLTGGQSITSQPRWAVSSQVGLNKTIFRQPDTVAIDGTQIIVRTGNGDGQKRTFAVLPDTTPTSVALSADDQWVAYVGIRYSKDHKERPTNHYFAAIRRTIKGGSWKILSGSSQLDVKSALAFSPNNRWLAIGGAGKLGGRSEPEAVVELWDCSDTPEQSVVIQSDRGKVNALCFSPDSLTLATASDGPGFGESNGDKGVVRLWDPRTGQQRLSLAGHHSHVHDVAFSPDGRQLLSASKSSSGAAELLLWDARDWDLQQGQRE